MKSFDEFPRHESTKRFIEAIKGPLFHYASDQDVAVKEFVIALLSIAASAAAKEGGKPGILYILSTFFEVTQVACDECQIPIHLSYSALEAQGEIH